MVNQAKQIHHRRSIRLKGYDYSEEANYFITVVTHLRKPIFGQVKNGNILLSPEGRIVSDLLNDLHNRFPKIIVDCCVIMPNHIHAILTISETTDNDEDVTVRAIHPTHFVRGRTKRVNCPYQNRARENWIPINPVLTEGGCIFLWQLVI